MKTVLVIDGGGRGAVLVDKILAIPGNDLMPLNTTKPVKTYPQFKTTNIKQIVKILHPTPGVE